MTTDNTVFISTGPASSAETLPSTEGTQVPSGGTGASEQAAETEQERQQRASDAGRNLAAQREHNRRNAESRLQRERDTLLEQNRELQRAYLERTRTPQETAKPTDTAPKRDQFDSYEAWIEAKADYRAEQKSNEVVKRHWQEAEQRTQQQRTIEQATQTVQAHASRVDTFAKQNADFAEVTNRDDVMIPEAASKAIMRAHDGPAMLHAIGRDPSIAARLNQMDPDEQVYFLGQLSSAIRTRPSQVSRAPSPGTPVGSRTGSVESDVRGMSIEQYYASVDPIRKAAARKGKS